jgi:hypothetical protein
VAASKATTVDEYLAELEPERRAAVEAVLEVVREHIPAGYEEGMQWGMVAWYVPLERYPDTYNGQPLQLAALASQKRHLAIYLNGIYADEGLRERFEQRYRESGKRMDVGKSCVRFRALTDLPLDVVGWAVAQLGVDEYIERYEASR